MRTIEALGLTKEVFKKMYDEYSGFNNAFNKNHLSYKDQEKFLTFLKEGSIHLINENNNLVTDIIQRS